MKLVSSIFSIFVATSPALADETCGMVTHSKLSLADFAEGPEHTDNFFYSDESELIREGELRISGNIVEVEFEEFRDIYECRGARFEPCIRINGDKRFLGEIRVDMAIGVVVQLESHVADDFNPFLRGGVANSSLSLWKVLNCKASS